MDDELPGNSTAGTILFQIKQKYNEDDLLALYKLNQKRTRSIWGKQMYTRVCALAGALVLLAITGVGLVWTMTKFYLFPLPLLLLIIWTALIPRAIGLLIAVAFYPSIDKKSLKEAQERTISFYGDHFTVEDVNTTTEYKYKGINKFLETNSHCFIYIATWSAIILRKSCFVVGASKDFGPFMKEKYRTKDMEPSEKGL